MKKTFYIFTIGCQMNVADSQNLEDLLIGAGWKKCDEHKADLIIANACSVRQKAVDRIWGKIKKWQRLDKTNIFIVGCVLPKDKIKFEERGIKAVATNKFINDILLEMNPANIKRTNKKQAFITIMEGCDNFCSYCAVPLTRGREISKPIDKIIKEAEAAIANNTDSILLLGQNVNSYKYDFSKLLKKIDSLPYDFSFNFLSPNPQDMTDSVVNVLAHLKKWHHEIHLPLQSGDDKILKRMNRKYTIKRYLEIVSKLRMAIPNLKITTDVIVGFPGETKSQFLNTYKLCQQIGFSKAYVSQYSPRAGTVAEKFDDDVTPEEKYKRWLKLDRLINS